MLDTRRTKAVPGARHRIAHEEIFGQYCHTAEYVRCPVDMAFEYAAKVREQLGEGE